MDAIADLNSLIAARVRPTLRRTGFIGTGATLERLADQAIQVVNLQRDTRNTASAARLYLNGGCYFPGWSTLLGRPVTARPTAPDCQVRMRPSELLPVEQFYEVTAATDLARLGDAISSHLSVLLDALDELSTADAAADWLAERKLTAYEEVFGWYLFQDRVPDARRFVTSLHEHFGGQARWSIFAAHLDEVERMVGRQVGWRNWLDAD